MNYIEINISLEDASNQDIKDVVIALLSEHPFDSFAENENGLSAYIPKELYHEDQILSSLNDIKHMFPFSWEIKKIKEQNWNKTWEENYPAVTIAGRCHIRAPFHPQNPDAEFDLLIEPKMSFGTAHHETTSMMIELLLDNKNVSGMDVLDMGCGTGVLAILASKKGAAKLLAIDNDEWAFANSLENVERNNCPNVTVKMGDEQAMGDDKFDIILANINRNILLQQIDSYAAALKPNGKIYMSGFYEADIPHLRQGAEKHGLALKKNITRNNWAAIILG